MEVVRWTVMSGSLVILLLVQLTVSDSITSDVPFAGINASVNVPTYNNVNVFDQTMADGSGRANYTKEIKILADGTEFVEIGSTDQYRMVPAERRALDLSFSENSETEDLRKQGDYFVKEEKNSTTAASEGGNRKVDVIQRLSRPSKQRQQKQYAEKTTEGTNVGGVSESVSPGSASGVEWLLNVYNPHRWNPRLLPGDPRLSTECRENMQIYLNGLSNGTIWAAKMTDASGRYSSQFFFGNDFWLGSQTLCEELQNVATNKILPPFEATFHVAKLKLRLHPYLTPVSRLIYLGVCLPSSCSGPDVAVLLQPETSTPSADLQHHVQVLHVRPVPGKYSLFRDVKFQLLACLKVDSDDCKNNVPDDGRDVLSKCCDNPFGDKNKQIYTLDSTRKITVTTVLLVLLVLGTTYEAIIERRQKRREKSRANNNEMEASDKLGSPLNKITTTVQVAMDQDKQNLNNSRSDISSADSFQEPVSVFGQILLSFSALTNGRKILHCGEAPKDSITCIHGLRFLSLAWVIMVHTYLQVFAIAENKTLRTLTERNFMFQTVSNATFSVDTFFFISGLLVTYLYYKSQREDSIEKPTLRRQRDCSVEIKACAGKFFSLLSYRFIRLTPAYMFVLLIAEVAMRWIKSNSVFEPMSLDDINCANYWWRNALYINSLFPRKEMCMLWSWYLSNDTQFYAIGILLILVSTRYFRVAVVGLFVFLLTSWVTTALISLKYEYEVRVQEPFGLFDELYDKPWTRLGPYLVGIIGGWYLYKTKCRVHFSKFTTLTCWVLSVFIPASLVYGVLNAQLGVKGTAVYVALGHTAWGMSLCWIVIACCTGHGGYVDTLLSCRLLQPLSRLTYCAYLIHPIIMVLTSFQMDGPLHLLNLMVMILYFGNVVASFIVSFFISIMLEAPVVCLLKIAMEPRPARRQN